MPALAHPTSAAVFNVGEKFESRNGFAIRLRGDGREDVVNTELPSIARLPQGLSPSGARQARKKSSFVSEAVASVGPAVVRIDTERLVDRVPLESYFFHAPESQKRRLSGQGSGVILSEDGLIMTNSHVVKDATKVTVTLTDGRTFKGTVKGSDDFIDLAAVKIQPKGRPLPTAPLGKHDELRVGDWAIAIGNAFGLDSTVTLGIISSLTRTSAEIGIPGKKVNFIQTDAAINPGNSGGPLVNEFGEVIGVNTAIKAHATGIGFAIPIDIAEKAMRELAAGKRIPHAYLGISMSDLTEESAKQNNDEPNADVQLPVCNGVLVLNVEPASPAAKAGIRKYDVVQAINGQTVRTASDASAIVDGFKVGQTIKVKVVRGNDKYSKTVILSVTTGDLNDKPDNQPNILAE